MLVGAGIATDICGSTTHVKTNDGLLCIIIPRGHSIADDPSSWTAQNSTRAIESELIDSVSKCQQQVYYCY